MTCVVGVSSPRGVVIAADSCGMDGSYSFSAKRRKIFANGSYLIGYTTSFRMGQALEVAGLPEPGVQFDRSDLRKFLIRSFVPAARAALRDAGFIKTINGVEFGGSFLVAIGGRLFAVEDDFQIHDGDDPYLAIGCGDLIARGALHVLSRVGPPKTLSEAKNRAFAALRAAEAHSAGVRSPFLCSSIAVDQWKVEEPHT